MTWDCYTTTEPTARKEHTCSGCHGTIHPGDTYSRTSGLWEGESLTLKWCGRCEPFEDCHMRPDEALVRLSERDMRGLIVWDGRVMTMHGYEHLGQRKRGAVYEATMIPGVGLTDWAMVESDDGFGWRRY